MQEALAAVRGSCGSTTTCDTEGLGSRGREGGGGEGVGSVRGKEQCELYSMYINTWKSTLSIQWRDLEKRRKQTTTATMYA